MLLETKGQIPNHRPSSLRVQERLLEDIDADGEEGSGEVSLQIYHCSTTELPGSETHEQRTRVLRGEDERNCNEAHRQQAASEWIRDRYQYIGT